MDNIDKIVEKYGISSESIRFKLDDWVLVTPPEGVPGLDLVHGCHRKAKDGVMIQWSYCLLSNSDCPGCGAVIPDEIQGLYQMANADCLHMRYPKGWMQQEIARAMRAAVAEWDKHLFITGVGDVDKGCKSE